MSDRETMLIRVQRLYGSFRSERGDAPAAVIMHPDDWDALRACVDASGTWMTPRGLSGKRGSRVMGMAVLIDVGQHRGFPICSDRALAAERLERGAHAA